MKRLLLLALCALFALNAEARTLYVNASRPNNKGNGLSAKKAKKTIQAAINIAKKGDTILVYPGAYAPIKTNNKKIAIKSITGRKKTKISWGKGGHLAELGNRYVYYEYGVTAGYRGEPMRMWKRRKINRYTWKGTSSTLTGFRVMGLPDENDPLFASFWCVLGGTVSNCLLDGTGTARMSSTWEGAAKNTKLVNCTVRNMYCMTGAPRFEGCTLQRCKVLNNGYDFASGPSGSETMVVSSEFYNCLFAANRMSGRGNAMFTNSVLVNCTVADNTMNTTADGERFATKSKFYNCILRNNYSQKTTSGWDNENGPLQPVGPKKLHNVDDGNTYKNTDKTNGDPKFVNAAKGDYRLKRGSHCINSGKLTKKQKKLVGTTDLAGRKRIKGKAIDRGCYEY